MRAVDTALRTGKLSLPLLLLAGCLTVPVAPDRAEFSRFAPPQKPGVEMSVTPLRVASVKAPACAAAGQASCASSSEVVHVAYLVKHPQGTFLIDSAFSSRGKQDLKRFGLEERLAFHFELESSLGRRLAEHGSPKLDFVLVTHAHWDHTSGLVDLRHPRVVLGPGEAEYVRAFPSDKPPTVRPDHLSAAAVESFAWDGPAFENFPRSHDWFGDGSVVLVPLPGHTPGSIGVFLSTVAGRRLFFVGDAAWSMRAVELPSHKLKLLSDIVDADRETLSETLWRLHHLHEREPELLMVPAHDGAACAAVEQLAAGH